MISPEADDEVGTQPRSALHTKEKEGRKKKSLESVFFPTLKKN